MGMADEHSRHKRKSVKLIKYIFSSNLLTALYYFIQYWHDHEFRFVLRKAKKYFAEGK